MDNSLSVEKCPLVSITIPSYNAASTIAETLDSVLAQTYPNVEVIVVDDGSTDDTQDVLGLYASKVTCIRQNNGGLASARNVGCRAAHGKYIALMDADDLCMPERIAVQVAYMEQHPEIVMCSSDFAAFNNSGLISDSYIGSYYMRIPATSGGVAGLYPYCEELSLNGYEVTTYSGDIYEQMALGSFIHPPTVLFRRSILDECGLVDEDIINCCDSEWFVRMSRIGKIGFIACPLIKYRLSEHQMSGSLNYPQISMDMVYVMEKVLKADPGLFLRNRKLFRQYLGQNYLGAADALVDDQPLAAVTKLIKSVTCGIIRTQSLKVLVKAFTPNVANALLAKRL